MSVFPSFPFHAFFIGILLGSQSIKQKPNCSVYVLFLHRLSLPASPPPPSPPPPTAPSTWIIFFCWQCSPTALFFQTAPRRDYFSTFVPFLLDFFLMVLLGKITHHQSLTCLLQGEITCLQQPSYFASSPWPWGAQDRRQEDAEKNLEIRTSLVHLSGIGEWALYLRQQYEFH